MADLPTVNAFWIGPELGPIHVACLLSFTRHGHRVVLHGYERPADVPKGVEFSDARLLLPESMIFRQVKTGSYAPFSDLFRYEVLAAGLGLWVDCDVYCLRPISDAPYIFGWHGKNLFNTAVLKLPPDCPVLQDLCRLKLGSYDLPWAKRTSWTNSVRRLIRSPVPLAKINYLDLGPRAFTWLAMKHGIDRHAAPADVFYPLHFYYVGLLFEPGLSLTDITTRRSVAIHLYNEKIQRDQLSRIPPKAPLAEILAPLDARDPLALEPCNR